MAKSDPVLEKVREICLSLPDTRETMTWGHPHFRVGEKIFAGYGEEKGQRSLGFKLEMEHALAIVERDPRFTRAPYVGHKGWVSMDASGGVKDWNEVRALVLESYRLIAPKRSLAKLEGSAAVVKKNVAKKGAAKKPAVKPVATGAAQVAR
jgi:predicted DNA-binding protein (MmcQ/YjbR family)